MQQLNQPGHKTDQQPSSTAVLKNAYNYREAARSKFDPGNRLPWDEFYLKRIRGWADKFCLHLNGKWTGNDILIK
jgi:N-acetyl-anhydromuramyl-L-alanine amidase AmpD